MGMGQGIVAALMVPAVAVALIGSASAGAAGSVTSFSVEIDRKFTHRGRPRSVVTATWDGVLDARGEAVFADGMRVEGTVSRPCTPVG